MKSQLLIAAAHSGAGKTTVTLGLLKALQRRGYRVQPFKCGPDFIDPLHHYAAAAKTSINLDRFMMSDAHLNELYHRYGSEADVCITEGVMGLFDGASRMEGSSADIARLLQLPVVLVLNAKAMAYTAAAILYGLKHFCRDINLAGVIFNFVDSASHYQILKEAAEDVGVKALGHLPVEKTLRIPSRYLGLDTSAETDRDAVISAAADHIEKYLDVEALLECTRTKAGTTGGSDRVAVDGLSRQACGAAEPGRRMILVARDAAFNFIYPENIRCLEQFGTVRYFSPMRDTHLPSTDLIYLPGGYPEWHLDALAANGGLLRQIRDYYAQGGKILAECGGMMYLGRSITDEQGRRYPMTGILDLATGVEQKKLSLGYRILRTGGRSIRGHEFHYSQFTSPLPERASTGTILNARQEPTDTPLFHNSKLFASYMHLYWAEQPELLKEWFSW